MSELDYMKMVQGKSNEFIFMYVSFQYLFNN
jgi:hypothetical protein